MTSYQQYKVCIEACLQCATICNYCAIECSREPHAHHMARCIQLNLECVTICCAFASLMTYGSDKVNEIAHICALMCDACAEECSKHTEEHCIECADVCTKCADQCELIKSPVVN
jgi:hypothetical protein